MILVTVGTQDKSFKRLIEAIDHQFEAGLIQEEVIVQSGYTQYASPRMTIIPYFSQDDLDQYRQEASLVITHGGVGSILDALRYHKKVIGVARLKQYKEHINDHQVEILEKFAKEGHLLYASDLAMIPSLIKEARDFTPTPYPFNNKLLLDHVKKVIDSFINE